MKRVTTALLALLFAALLMAHPLLAQGTPVSESDLIDLPVIGTTEAGDPIYGVPVLPVEATPADTAIPVATTIPLPPAVPDTTTTNTLMNGLFLLVVVLVVGFVIVVWLVLNHLAKNGNTDAAQIVNIIKALRDSALPKEATENRLSTWMEEAKNTPGFMDDLRVLVLQAGWKLIGPSGEEITAQTATKDKASVSTSHQTGDARGAAAANAAIDAFNNTPEA